MTGDEVKKETMCMGNLSDIEVAGKVRMLMRYDLDHEAVCTAGRDRIMYLSQQLEKWKREAEPSAPSYKQLQITLGKIAAGYTRDDENWTELDEAALMHSYYGDGKSKLPFGK